MILCPLTFNFFSNNLDAFDHLIKITVGKRMEQCHSLINDHSHEKPNNKAYVFELTVIL